MKRISLMSSAWAACALVIVGLDSTASAGVETEVLSFRVILGEREIGYHRFVITHDGQHTRVESKAEFDVRLLRIPLYRYRHSNTEHWHDGCLARISSRTDANGERFVVDGERRAMAFRLGTADDAHEIDAACVKTFAYWNRDFLRQKQLLNPQTGQFVAVRVEPLPRQKWPLHGGEVPVEGYRIMTDVGDTDIDVWYRSDQGRWIGLESRLQNDRVLRYVPDGADELERGDRDLT